MGLRRLLILSHRWLGIPMSLIFVVWFVSGVVMMYAGGMPQLSAEERLEHLPPLELDAVRLPPGEAGRSAGAWSDSAATTLTSVLGRPAYRFGRGAYATTVFADTGELLEPLGPKASRAVAARFVDLPEERLRFVGTVTEPDQWTLTQAGNLPLHEFRVDDDAGTVVYVSPQQAEVTLTTTRLIRTLAWVGTIPHWFYFTPLRVNQPLWYWSIVVASTLGCVLAVLGLALGVTQFRRSKPFRLSASIRYRGWMRWHYILGVAFGVSALTWAFSGLMSVEPFEWTRAQGIDVPRSALAGDPVGLSQFGVVEQQDFAAVLGELRLKEIELLGIQDRPYYLARVTAGHAAEENLRRERLHQPYLITGRSEPDQLLIAADTLAPRNEPFATESILSRIRGALPPDVGIVEHELLQVYDAYYYSRAGEAPLPVLRIKLDDPLDTWIYVDPQLSRIVAEVHRYGRVERWLFNGLHSLDFGFWYDRRPLWDIAMILLSVGALITSVIGLVFGVKRLARSVAR